MAEQGAGQLLRGGGEQGGALEHAVEAGEAGVNRLRQLDGVVVLEGHERGHGRTDLVRRRRDVFRNQL